MDCREFRETFSDYLDGMLDEADEIRARGHLASCPICLRFERAYRAGVEALRGLPAPAPSRDACARLLHGVRRDRTPPEFLRSYALGGALLVASFAAALLLDRRVGDDPVEPGPRLPSVVPVLADLPVERNADVITVHVVRGDFDLPLPDPFFSPSTAQAFEASRVRFDVPAVWAGR